MARYYTDCRDSPSVSNCTVAISADDRDELVEAAAQHAITVHEHDDTPELRKMVAKDVHQGMPAQ